MSVNSFKITAETDRALVDSAAPTERFLEVKVTAPRQESNAKRLPVNVALIIDRSGSMQGAKLDYARKAALHILDTLAERDRAAVVAYDDEIILLSPSVTLSDSRREELKREVSRLSAGNSTNLGGGWLRGAQEVAENLIESGVNRALLLTDGLANVGIVDPHELAKHASELRQRKVSTSTFGIGLGFNEYLLESMAEHGGGKFYYIDSPDRIPSIFAEELGEMLAITAREVNLRVHHPSNVKLELLSAIPHDKTAESASIPLGDFCSGQAQSLYFKVIAPPSHIGERLEIHIEAAFADTDNAPRVERVKAVLTYAATTEVESATRNRRVEELAAEVDFAGAMQHSLVMERRGDRAGAARLVRDRVLANAAYAPSQAMDEMLAFANDIETGLSEDDRKLSHARAYNQKRQKS